MNLDRPQKGCSDLPFPTDLAYRTLRMQIYIRLRGFRPQRELKGHQLEGTGCLSTT